MKPGADADPLAKRPLQIGEWQADSVYQSISQLRSVVGDEVSQPRYIVTVPRKGYRLVAAISEVVPAVTPALVVGSTAAPLLPQSEPEPEPKRRVTDLAVALPAPSTRHAQSAVSAHRLCDGRGLAR
ncbi:winged helix-turn-helix domain-containing protein [Roseateles sp.]|uniref:winged helix-turn-helix domain-containing protein n=1 Tax=Roseateles sp. TaxID=1971397 RepID=UPI003BA59A45